MSNSSASYTDHVDSQLDGPNNDDSARPPSTTSLHFSVRFFPSDFTQSQSESQPSTSQPSSDPSSSPRSSSKSPPSTQSINLTFQDGFQSCPDDPLRILVRADRTVRNLVPADTNIDGLDIDVDDLSQSFQRICFVDEPINLFPPPPVPSRRYSIATLISAVALLLLLSLPLLLLLLPAGPLSHKPLSSQSSSPPRDIVVRHAPLIIFDDLWLFFRHYIQVPQPLVGGVQDIVDKHYHLHNIVPRNKKTPTLVSFVADLEWTSSQLCWAIREWAWSTQPSREPDLDLLCEAISRTSWALLSRWYDAIAILLISWPSAFSSATLHLAAAVKELPKEGHRALGLPDIRGMRNGTIAQDVEQVLFYNASAQAFLRELNTAFFQKHQHHQPWSADPDDFEGLLPFPAAVYDAAHAIEAVENSTLVIVTHLSLLLAILREDENILSAIQAQRDPSSDKNRERGPGTSSWFPNFWPPSATTTNVTKVATAYHNTIPWHTTCTSLLWVVGFARGKIKAVVRDMEALGNYTESLLAVNIPSELGADSVDAAQPWWRGTPWVTEAADSGKTGRLVRTYFFVPSARVLSLVVEELRDLGRQEARRYTADLEWLIRAAWEK